MSTAQFAVVSFRPATPGASTCGPRAHRSWLPQPRHNRLHAPHRRLASYAQDPTLLREDPDWVSTEPSLGCIVCNVTNTAPLLSTLAASGATIVAIVGGLLVSRYVTLDGEQRAARRRLDEGLHSLATARSNLSDAEDDLFRAEAFWHLQDTAVYDMLRKRHLLRTAADESGRVDPGPITLEEIRIQIGLGVGYRTVRGREFYQARLALLECEMVTAIAETEAVYRVSDESDGQPPSWPELRGQFPQHEVSSLWEWVCRWRQGRIRQPGETTGRLSLTPGTRTDEWGPSPDMAVRLASMQPDDPRDRRKGLLDEARRTVELEQIQVQQAREALDEVARPGGLILGLSVLVVLTVTTVVVPVLFLVPTPADLTWTGGAWIVGTFFLGLTTLLLYLGWWARALIRGRQQPL